MIGKTISHYRIVEELGRGGMGIVYKAEDTKLQRTVAIKVLKPEAIGDPEAKERFIREARAASALNHPNITTIYEIDEWHGRDFIVMEYVEGQTVKEKVKAGPLSIDEAIDIATQTAEALKEAHEHEIVHRDVKSDNIMVTEKGQVKVMDFGLAKLKGAATVTKTGTTMGTVTYMSPEQAKGEEVDHRTDLWSLGVVTYEMVPGQLPFKGDYEQAVIYSILNERPLTPLKLNPDVTKEIAKTILKALEKGIDSRYQSSTELLGALTDSRKGLQPDIIHRADLKGLLYSFRKPKFAIPCAVAIGLLVYFGYKTIDHSRKVKWAREVALPEIERLVMEEGDIIAAFPIAMNADRIIPNDPFLKERMRSISRIISIYTEPSGADIFYKAYENPEDEWNYLGKTPTDSTRIPRAVFRWKIEKEEYETIEVASTGTLSNLKNSEGVIVLDKLGKIPAGMVHVRNGTVEEIEIGDFYADKYEVTNKQYKEFVDNGGYDKQEYWQHEFIKNGRRLTWEQAMAEFVDADGMPGPATWKLGKFPAGQGEYPVAGVSWYEAAAYSHFVGKSLPTIYHWRRLARAPEIIVALSNLDGDDVAPAGAFQGLGIFGTFDIAGNVSEWCLNAAGGLRYHRGGAWDYPKYWFQYKEPLSPFVRSSTLGLRCVKYMPEYPVPENALAELPYVPPHDYSNAQPCSDEIFEFLKEYYKYEKTELDARIEAVDSTAQHWIRQKISFNAAYNNERMIAYLYLPKLKGTPPYQTVIYIPGSYSAVTHLFDNYGKSAAEWTTKSGRAFLFPVYKGSFERGGGLMHLKGKCPKEI